MMALTETSECVGDLTKKMVIEMIRSKSCDISFTMASGKNPKWKQFHRVLYNRVRTDFISCINCGEVLTHKKSSGTNPIILHRCKHDKQLLPELQLRVNRVTANHSLIPIINANVTKNLKTKTELKAVNNKRTSNVTNLNSIQIELTDSIVLCCATDLRSFSLIESNGFLILAQKLIEIGSRYGYLRAVDIMPSLSTVSNRVVTTYDTIKEKLYNFTKDVGGIGVTMELWKHELSEAKYLTLTGHYIVTDYFEKTWKIKNFDLATREVKQKESEFNIEEIIDAVLYEFGCSNDNNYFLNIDDTLLSVCEDREKYVYSCSAHNINLALINTFNDDHDSIKKINKEIEKVKSIVELMIIKGQMKKFSKKYKTIPQLDENRYNYYYLMLKNFVELYSQLKEFLTADDDIYSVFLSCDGEIIDEIVQILEMLENCILLLSKHNTPTIHLTIQVKRKLISRLEVNAIDKEIINDFKLILKSNIEYYLKIHFIHIFALIFDPKRKDLKLLNEDERKQVIEVLVDNMETIFMSSRNQYQHQLEITYKEQPQKKKKMSFSEEFLYESDEEDVEENESEDMFEKEVDIYLKAKLCDTFTSDLLKFWFEHSKIYPNIANVAKKVLALPATQFDCERCLGANSSTLQMKRCRLPVDNIDYLLFIRSNSKK